MLARGIGSRADWRLTVDLARDFSLILAGGLDPSNVEEAIAVTRPLAVDVSGGVETDGEKNRGQIEAFVAAARRAFAARDPGAR
jgi:phosphoribosylanthranilate isomerase